MAVSQQKALAMAGVCALLVLAFLASDVSAACSIAQLNQCIPAVAQGSAPTAACCQEVGAINDFNCFCSILLSQRNVKPEMIDHALHVPMNCGPQGAKLRQQKCGGYTIP